MSTVARARATDEEGVSGVHAEQALLASLLH
jgi:hypothetical protein